MRNFLIGQYGAFDYAKYQRDFRDTFYGIEACLFQNEEDADNLLKEAEARSFHIGVHFPLRADRSGQRDALFLSQDQKIRDNAFQRIQQELDYLSSVKPAYVLFHYPKPVILDDRVDWSRWRFQDPSEFVYESSCQVDDFVEKSEYLFRWLSAKSDEYDFTPILEFDGLNKYIYETDLLEKLLNKYTKIRLCLDTGRLWVQEQIDPYFDSRQVVKKFASYTALIHLWNLQYLDGHFVNHRYPVLPEQSTREGWAPIEEYLGIIIQGNSNVKVQFEHRSDLVSDADLDRCYNWVNQMLNHKGIQGEEITVKWGGIV